MATTYLSDTFTDANGTLLENHTMNVGPGWTSFKFTNLSIPQVPSWQIQSNTVQPGDFPVGLGQARGYQANAGFADVIVSFTYTMQAIQQSVIMVLRYTDNLNFVLIEIDRDGTLTLDTLIAGVDTILATVALTPDSAPHVLQARCTGSTIAVSIDGAVVLTETVAFNQTATRFGMSGWNENSPRVTIDNFLAVSAFVDGAQEWVAGSGDSLEWTADNVSREWSDAPKLLEWT